MNHPCSASVWQPSLPRLGSKIPRISVSKGDDSLHNFNLTTRKQTELEHERKGNTQIQQTHSLTSKDRKEAVTTFWDLSLGCQPYLLSKKGAKRVQSLYRHMKVAKAMVGYAYDSLSGVNGCKTSPPSKKGEGWSKCRNGSPWVFPWLTLSASVDWLSTEREKKGGGKPGWGKVPEGANKWMYANWPPKRWGN